MRLQYSRRTMLSAAGTSLALPLLQVPSLRAESTAAPKRLLFLNFGFGPSKVWYPSIEKKGKDFEPTKAFEPLNRHKNSYSLISNLSNLQSAGMGPHWGSTTFLTGANTRRTPGRPFHNDISCDQIAAQYLGKDVRFPSIEITSDKIGMGPGASMAWDKMGDPIPGEFDHVSLFNLLFGGGDMTVENRRKLLQKKRSVLDLVRLDAQRISKVLGKEDRQKVGQYFTLLRNIEGRLNRNEQWLEKPLPKAPFATPKSNLTGTADYEMMFDLITVAFQTDSSRVITYRLPTDGVLDEYAKLTGNPRIGAHPMTHYGDTDSPAYKQLIWRDTKICEMFATLLDKLKAAKDVDGRSLLDNCLVVMGSGIRTGHNRRNVPILFAGGGGSQIKHGLHHVYKEDEGRLANLWLGMMQHAGCPVKSFADSTEPLSEIFV